MVVANLHGVAAIAREYRHFRLQEVDLIQEGTLGLMHAVKRFFSAFFVEGYSALI